MIPTKISSNETQDNIWTQENLISGKNISISKVAKPLIDSNTLAVLHFEEAFDNAVIGSPITCNASKNLVAGKFGSATYWSSNGAGWLGNVMGNWSHAISTGDFTVEFWAKLQNAKYVYDEKSQGIRFNIGYKTGDMQSESLSAYIAFFGTEVRFYDFSETIQYTEDVWHHVAIERESGFINYYFDGKYIGTSAGVHNINYSTGSRTNFCYFSGGGYLNSRYIQFNIDELRLSNVSRYKKSDYTLLEEPFAYGTEENIYQISNTQKIDTDLSNLSENPVQNRAVTLALNTKQNNLTDLQIDNINYAYTKHNLITDSTISIEDVFSPTIDINTLGVWHFDKEKDSNFLYENAVVGSGMTFAFKETNDWAFAYDTSVPKFGTGNASQYSTYAYTASVAHYFIGGTYPALSLQDYTVDFWYKQTEDTSPYIYLGGLYLILSTNSNTDSKIYYNSTNTNLNIILDKNVWYHIAYERYNGIGYLYINGNKPTTLTEGISDTYSISYSDTFRFYGMASKTYNFKIDELRISDKARYRGNNFVPFDQPYGGSGQQIISANIPVMTGATSQTQGTSGLVPAPLAGSNDRYLSSDGTWKVVQGGGGSAPITTWFKNNTGTTLNTGLSLTGTYEVYKNGLLLEESILESDSDDENNDFSVSGSIITFTIPLIASDKIAVKIY